MKSASSLPGKQTLTIDEQSLTIDQALGLAVEHHNAGQRPKAKSIYQQVLRANPNQHVALHLLGLIRHQMENHSDAIDLILKSLVIKPDYTEAHNNLGNIFQELGRMDEAVASYHKALAIKPDYAGAHYNLSLVHKLLPGDPQIAKLRELLESRSLLVDEKTKLQFALAKALDDTGVYAEASSYFWRANEAMAKQAIARHKQFDRIGHRKTVNEVKRVVFRQRPRAAKKKAEAEHTPIFVVGMSRSGKTLVESLLGQHDGVLKNGEGFELHNAINEVRDNYALPKFPPKFMETLNGKQIDEIGALYTQKSTSKFPESQYSVNTMPGQFLHLGLIFNALANAKVVYIIRDSLDSCLFQYFKRYARIAYANNFSDIAWYCADYQEMMSHWKKLYGNQILDVRYEDLVSNPDETGRLVFQHCGLDLDPAKVCSAFTTDEIGHWRHYPEEADILRRALEEQRQLANKTEI